jgi:peptidoglycan LD-endopeptidase LytH
MAVARRLPAGPVHSLSRFRSPKARSAPLAAAQLLFVLAACGPIESVQEYFREPESPHEAYLFSLEKAGLHETALGSDWTRAAGEALREGVRVELPYREEGFFQAREPTALGYRFQAQRGQRLQVEIMVQGAEDARLFLDLYREGSAGGGAEASLVLVASGASDGSSRLEHTVRRTGSYTLRLQPELLRGGRYELALRTGPSLAFPVDGRDTRAVQSFFGAPRDGGRREHHGVDIFAPRGTPVLASSEATVTRVSETPIGGRIVWLRDNVTRVSLYYAHLDSQYVSSGGVVVPGDTLGFVGNTGNARTTPPHLHFGVYAHGEGPVDPMPWLREAPPDPGAFSADSDLFGDWVRVAVEGSRFRESPGTRAAILDELSLATPLHVVAGSGDWLRVRLPDGRSGFVAARLIERAETPLHRHEVAAGRLLQAVPDTLAPVVAHLPAGSDVDVLGRFGSFLYVQPPAGPAGWMTEGF